MLRDTRPIWDRRHFNPAHGINCLTRCHWDQFGVIWQIKLELSTSRFPTWPADKSTWPWHTYKGQKCFFQPIFVAKTGKLNSWARLQTESLETLHKARAMRYKEVRLAAVSSESGGGCLITLGLFTPNMRVYWNCFFLFGQRGHPILTLTQPTLNTFPGLRSERVKYRETGKGRSDFSMARPSIITHYRPLTRSD